MNSERNSERKTDLKTSIMAIPNSKLYLTNVLLKSSNVSMFPKL
jgi:hypothetical protein